jgi:OOP family OmpA-OmpF porin
VATYEAAGGVVGNYYELVSLIDYNGRFEFFSRLMQSNQGKSMKFATMKLAFIAVFSFSFSQHAFAIDRDVFYVGGGLGQANATNFCGSVSSTYSCNSSSQSRSAFIGFQTNRYFAIELGYLDLGKMEIQGSGLASDCNPNCSNINGAYTYSDTFSAKGVRFSTIGSVPLGRGLFISGKLGLLHWTATEQSTLNSTFPSNTHVYPVNGWPMGHPFSSMNHTETGNAPVVGLGLKYEIGEQLAARFEFEMTPHIQGTYTKYDYSIYSASLLYKF